MPSPETPKVWASLEEMKGDGLANDIVDWEALLGKNSWLSGLEGCDNFIMDPACLR